MSSKQKIAISAIGIVLVLAIIGLTIGLVLVANQAIVTNTLNVTYEATNVDCSISGTAQQYDRDGEEIGSVVNATPALVEIDAGATSAEAEAGTLTFSEIKIEDSGKAYVVFSFTITNTGATGAPAIKAVGEVISTGTNMTVEPDSTGATSIAVGGEPGVVTFTARVTDPSIAASFNGTVKLTITQA